jgi:hypothetical protein
MCDATAIEDFARQIEHLADEGRLDAVPPLLSRLLEAFDQIAREK